jgi:anti-anti-sigma factor
MIAVARVAGELDSSTAYELVTAVGPALTSDHHSAVVLDLRAVTFADSAGLGAIATLARHANDAGIELALRSCSPAVAKLLSISGLDRIVDVWPDQ